MQRSILGVVRIFMTISPLSCLSLLWFFRKYVTLVLTSLPGSGAGLQVPSWEGCRSHMSPSRRGFSEWSNLLKRFYLTNGHPYAPPKRGLGFYIKVIYAFAFD
jgi:hypothetical protein